MRNISGKRNTFVLGVPLSLLLVFFKVNAEDYIELAKFRIDKLLMVKRVELIKLAENNVRKNNAIHRHIRFFSDTNELANFSRQLDSISGPPHEDRLKYVKLIQYVNRILDEMVVFAEDIGTEGSNPCHEYITLPLSYSILFSIAMAEVHPFYLHSFEDAFDKGHAKYIAPFCPLLKEFIFHHHFSPLLSLFDSCSLSKEERDTLLKVLDGRSSEMAYFGDTISENKILDKARDAKTYDEIREAARILSHTATAKANFALVKLLNRMEYKEEIQQLRPNGPPIYCKTSIQYELIERMGNVFPDEQVLTCDLRKAHLCEYTKGMAVTPVGATDSISTYFDKVYQWAFKNFGLKLTNLKKVNFLERYDLLSRDAAAKYVCGRMYKKNPDKYEECLKAENERYDTLMKWLKQ